MYWILFVMGAIAAVVIALLVGGLVTPREYTVTRSALLPFAPEQVWSALQTIIAASGQLELREEPSSDAVPSRITARLIADDQSDVGAWTWTLLQEDAATRVTLTEHGDIANPIARIVRAQLGGHHKNVERHLQELEAQLTASGAQRAGRSTPHGAT